MTETQSIRYRYRQANAENFQVIDWLVTNGICRDRIEAARFLDTPAGAFAIRTYRAR